MDSLRWWARYGEAVRQAIELGKIAHLETASAEVTEAFLLCTIESGLLQTWTKAFPNPRHEPEIGMAVSLPSPGWWSKCVSAPRAGLSSRPWIQLKPRRERGRSRRSWSTGTTSMLASR